MADILQNFKCKKVWYIFSLLLIPIYTFSQNSLCSWNLKDFGKSKSDVELSFIAKTINQFDIVAIQEVVAGDGGAQAVARLYDILNRMGSKWDYVVSDPTSGDSYKKERYAFIWKPSKVKAIGRGWLEKKYNVEIDREPFLMTFESSTKRFTIVNFHAITKAKQPETEIKYFKFFSAEYSDLNLIFCGDFNLPQSHSVFNPLKSQGYKSLLVNQKTSLRQKCLSNDCLASEYDNIFYKPEKVHLIKSGVVHFYTKFENLTTALLISDHIPIFFIVSLN